MNEYSQGRKTSLNLETKTMPEVELNKLNFLDNMLNSSKIKNNDRLYKKVDVVA